MRIYPLLFLFLPLFAHAQYSTYVGLNFTPLIIRTAEFHYEKRVSEHISLEGRTGIRLQNRDTADLDLLMPALKSYIGTHNFATFVAAGARFYNWDQWDYPYIAIHVIGTYYNEENVLRDYINPASYILSKTSGMRFGLSGTMGMVLNLPWRFKLDLAGQMTLHRPRTVRGTDPYNYFLAGMGYNTYATSFEIPPLLFQPVVTLKYDLSQNKRDQLHNQD